MSSTSCFPTIAITFQKLQTGHLEVISEGNFSIVYRHQLQSQVYKICKKDNQYRCYVREVEALQNLHHPNIIKLIDASFCPFSHQFYITIPYHPHGHMLESCTGLPGKSRASYVFKWCVDIANALSFIHSNGIVHLDVKPENVLISRDHSAILTDFGLCAGVNQHINQRGSPIFFAPEFLNSHVTSYSIDIYALGLTLFTCYWMHYPFKTDNKQELFDLIRAGRIEFPTNVVVDAITDNKVRKLVESIIVLDPLLRIGLEDIITELKWVNSALTPLALQLPQQAQLPQPQNPSIHHPRSPALSISSVPLLPLAPELLEPAPARPESPSLTELFAGDSATFEIVPQKKMKTTLSGSSNAHHLPPLRRSLRQQQRKVRTK